MSLPEGVSISDIHLPDFNSFNTIVGKELTKARKKAGFTATELAKRLGVSLSMISHIETGLRRPSKRKRALNLLEILDSLGVSDPSTVIKLATLTDTAELLGPDYLVTHNVDEALIINAIFQDLEDLKNPSENIEDLIDHFAPFMFKGDVLLHKARALSDKGKYPEALKIYKSVIDSDYEASGHDAEHNFNYSITLFNLGLEKQKSLFEKIIENYSTGSEKLSKEYHNKRLSLIKEYFSPSLKQAELAQKKDPFYRDALAQIANAKYGILHTQKKPAKKDINDALEAFTELSSSYLNPEFYNGTGNHSDAINKFSSLLIAQLYADSNNLSLAHMTLDRYVSPVSIRQNPDNLGQLEREVVGLFFYMKAVLAGYENKFTEVERLMKLAFSFEPELKKEAKYEISSESTIKYFQSQGRNEVKTYADF